MGGDFVRCAAAQFLNRGTNGASNSNTRGGATNTRGGAVPRVNF